jgi:DNA replication protein DnaC
MEVVMKLREKVVATLTELKYTGIHGALLQQLSSADFEDMSFLARLDDLLEHEVNVCQNKRISYLQKQAKLRWPNASIEGIKYELHPSLKPAKIKELAELVWVVNGHHVVITGATGTGKTYIACALALQAIMNAIPVLYFRFNELILNLVAADKNEKLTAFRRKLIKAPVLVVDDWGISPLSPIERHLLFELIESRDKKGSMIITSQYPIKSWHDAFQDPTLADATLDRIVHQTHEIVLKGESIRKVMGIKEGNQ